jgi:hypothetical protein
MMTEQQKLIMGIRKSVRLMIEILNEPRVRFSMQAKGMDPDDKLAELRGIVAHTLKDYDENGIRNRANPYEICSGGEK